MKSMIGKHAVTIVVATVAAVVAAGGIVGAHNRPDAGHVLSAHKARRANKVSGYTRIPLKKVSPSATKDSVPAARDAAVKVPLGSAGPFRVYAKCFKETSSPDNPGVYAEIYLRTTVSGAVFESDDGDDSSNGFLAPSTPEDDRELLDQSSYAGPGNPGTLNITDAEEMTFWAAAGRTHVTGHLFTGTKVGSPEAGNGVFGAGDRCMFGGFLASR